MKVIMCMTSRVKGTWRGACTHVHFYWEKRYGKIGGSSKLESPGMDILAWAKMETKLNVSVLSDLLCARFLNCVHAMPSPFHPLRHVHDEFYQAPSFFCEHH